VMTNLDHCIDRSIAARLQAEEVYAAYAAYNFCGYVWWDRGGHRWLCEIWRYKQHVDTVAGDSLEEIMAEASDTYGAA
jgi:hypothetical protein